MTLREQALWWTCGLVTLALVLWLLGDALLPFLLGMGIAYFTDPIADRLEALGLSRLASVVLITILTAGVATLAVLLVLPLLIEQVQTAVRTAPAYAEQVRALLAEELPQLAERSGFLRNAVETIRKNAETWSLELLQRLLSGGLALIDLLVLLVVTPVVAFYMLLDWDRMIAQVDSWLPRQHLTTIREIARQIDDVLSGFVRGQLTVCLVLGTLYAVALTVVGLDFGLLIGFVAGLISFIPYVGSILGGIASIGVAVVQFWDNPIWIVAVIGIFVAGQAIEGNFLTPKLVGDKVGLHPVWLMFALSAFGVMFGFIGLLVAVPAAAVIGVLSRFAIEKYREGPLYRGTPAYQRLERKRALPGRTAEPRTQAAAEPGGDAAMAEPRPETADAPKDAVRKPEEEGRP